MLGATEIMTPTKAPIERSAAYQFLAFDIELVNNLKVKDLLGSVLPKKP
jgi:hypothetical protein